MSAIRAPAAQVRRTTSRAWIAIEPMLQSLLAVAIAISICSFVLALTGFSALGAWQALIERTMLRQAGLEESVTRAIPLLIAGVAVLIAARCGLWNIGVDGQVLCGALAAATAGHALTDAPRAAMWIGAMGAAALAGALWIAIPALLRATWAINEIVTTIMFNYVALSMTSWLVKGPLRDESLVTPQTPLIPREMRFPLLGDSRVHIGIALAIVTWAGCTWFFRRTIAGFEMRAVGLGPRAARHAMIPVTTVLATALLASGAVAAMAGANDVLATKGTFQGEWNPEYGLTAFALVFLARRSVLGLVPAALFLGMLSYGADVMPRAAGIPSAFFPLFEGVLLVVLASMHWRPWRGIGQVVR